METLEMAMRRAVFLPKSMQPEIKKAEPVKIETPIEKPEPPKTSNVPAQLARESDPLLPEHPFPRVKEIQKVCCQYFDITLIEMISHRRLGPLVKARHVAMYMAKTLTPHSYPEIGRRFGRRDHTSILHACRKMTRLLPDSPDLQLAVKKISDVFKPKEI